MLIYLGVSLHIVFSYFDYTIILFDGEDATFRAYPL